MDNAEFFCLVSVVLDEARSAGIPVQVCCSAPDTHGFLRRVEYSVEAGASAIQVILPYYIQLDLKEALAFVETAARACGEVPLVHYNTGHAKLTFQAKDYRSLKERVPTLIGTKLPRDEPLWISNVCRLVPDASHFCGEYAFAANFAGGVKGMYSWLAVTNPRLTMRWYEACSSGDWNEAIRIQQLVNRFKLEVKTGWNGKSDAAVNKADAALNPNIHCDLRVREPYRSCMQEDLAMQWDELARLRDAGWCIAPHTRRHLWLAGPERAPRDDNEAWNEMAESKRELETRLGIESPYFAYPNGSCNATVTGMARKLFRTARLWYKAVEGPWPENRRNTDPHQLLGINIAQGLNFDQFRQIVDAAE